MTTKTDCKEHGFMSHVRSCPYCEESAIREIGELLRTQDNRATSDPIFIVQGKRRIWGMDPDLTDDVVWFLDDDIECESDELQTIALNEKHHRGESTEGWTPQGYIDTWEFVTACFTEKGCQDYIDANGHNLNEPRIYAASGYRNREFIAVREFLMTQGVKP